MDKPGVARTRLWNGPRLVHVLTGLTLVWLGATLALGSAVAGAATTATFGKTALGASTESFTANRKRVNRYTLPVGGSVSELSVYLTTTGVSGQQVLEGIVYADSTGSPGSLLGTTTQLTFTSTSTPGWYKLPFLAPLQIPAGEYWIGVITGAASRVAGYRYDKVAKARDYNANTFTSGPTDPFGSFTTDLQQMSLYATYTTETSPRPPVNSGLPAVTGTAQQGQALSAQNGSWTNEPTSFTYAWQRCDTTGANCARIASATAQSYTLVAADVGSTIRVAVTASNSRGASAPATSAQSAVVAAQQSSATFGKSTVGASSETFVSERKRVNRYALPTPGSVTKLSVYLAKTSTSGQQALKGLIYADTGTAPGALLGVSEQLTFHSTNAAGWYDLVFSAPLKLAAGNYWIGVMTGASAGVAGFRFDSVTASRDWNTNTYAAGPSNPFGSVTTDAEQTSLYATYTPQSAPSAPVNTAPPTITGTAQQGQALTAQNGSWTNEPTSFTYHWTRCGSAGANCAPVSGATAKTYALTSPDVGSTLRVSVIATNGGGKSEPAISAHSAVVSASSGVSHLEYVVQDGIISIYDMDNEFKLLKTISLPQTKAEVRGVSVAPSTHLMFISFGGDGGSTGPNGNGTGSVLAYDLLSEKVIWEVHLATGIDSGQVSPDATRLYMPIGENSASNIWNILNTENGAVIGTIKGGAAPHNTVASPDGGYVYLDARQSRYLDAYETATGKVKEIGPMVNTVRPFTVNGSNTLAFTSATEFDGFQVSSITTGKVLFTVSFAAYPKGFPFTTASHGVSLSPDESQLWVLDAVHKELQVWNVAGVKEGIAPSQIGVIALAGLTGTEAGCVYDCGRGGWLQRSTDGRYVFVGDSGEVIETATRKVLTTLPTLAQTKKTIEVDWQGGVPVATSGRSGVGGVG
jgi:hypothetical protein